MGKLFELLNRFRIWFLIILAIGAIIGWVSVYAELPSRVEQVECKVGEAGDAVKDLAHTVDKYAMVQQVRDESQDAQLNVLVEIMKKQNGD